MSSVELWIIMAGMYDYYRVVGMAASEDEAKRIIAKAYEDHGNMDGTMRDELDYEGPVKLGQIDLKRWKGDR